MKFSQKEFSMTIPNRPISGFKQNSANIGNSLFQSKPVKFGNSGVSL